MYKDIWKKVTPSVCSVNFISKSGISLTKLTGFKALGKFLVTDEAIYNVPKAASVRLDFMHENGCDKAIEYTIPIKEFKSRTIKGMDDGNPHFGLVNIDFPELSDIPSLSLSQKTSAAVGSPIAILGYQLDNMNVAIKTGIISSYVMNGNDKKYIQFDSTICQGNAGSPLINAENGEVIGIVGQRLTSLTKSYKRLSKIMNNNLAILKKSQGKFSIHEVDPIQVLIANQNQIKHIVSDIYKTANMRVGYAIESSNVYRLLEDFFDAEGLNSVLGRERQF